MGTKAHSGAMKFTRNLNHLNRLEAADEFDVASNFGLIGSRGTQTLSTCGRRTLLGRTSESADCDPSTFASGPVIDRHACDGGVGNDLKALCSNSLRNRADDGRVLCTDMATTAEAEAVVLTTTSGAKLRGVSEH